MQVFITIALIIIGVLLFEFIIFAHEFGHFITAKKSGVKVNEFALGMGPKLFSFQKGETKYTLRLFPIGGYCSMEGEDEDSDSPRAFNNAKIWKRMVIIVAGAFMNIVVGFLLMFIVTLNTPQFSSTVVSSFSPVAFSANTGLEVGDQIVNVGGYSVMNSKDLQFGIQLLPCKDVDPKSLAVYKEDCCITAHNYLAEMYQNKVIDDNMLDKLYAEILAPAAPKINQAEDKDSAYKILCECIDGYYAALNMEKPTDFSYPVIEVRDKRVRYTGDVTVIRNGKKIALKDVEFYTYFNDDEKTAVSIDFYVEPLEKNFATVMSESFTGTLSLGKSVWKSLVMLVQGRFSFADMSGPVGITKAVSSVAAKGLETGFSDAVLNIIFVMALITVNLGIVNMMPFPALDGGRFVFLVIEAIRRKPIPRKVEYIVNALGLALLILLIIIISVKDVAQLITGTFPSI